MKDSEGKEVLRARPATTKDSRQRTWLKLLPGAGNSPDLYVPGSRERITNPDGLYGHFGLDEDKGIEFADLIAIEVSATYQNFCDKRSRYAPGNSLALYAPPPWLATHNDKIQTIDTDFQNIPVRHLSVLYVLPSQIYRSVESNLHPWGQEYFVDDESFKQESSFESWFQLMTPHARFLSTAMP